MTALAYPSNLPCPLSTSLQRSERRLLSTLAGARQSRVASRDKISTRQITFLLQSPQQCSDWLLWGNDTLSNWAAWFSATWPTPEGGTTVQRFIGVPSYPQFQPSFNGWQVQATLQVRGRGVLPDAPVTPFFLLNHFQNMRAGNVASAIGPDLVLDSGAVLSSAESKFGGNSGRSTTSPDKFVASGFTPWDISDSVIGSWRAEGFFFETDPGGTTTWLSFTGTGSHIDFGPTSNTNFDMAYFVGGTGHATSGAVGDGTGKPAINVWHHAGIQYDAVGGNITCFLNGKRFNVLTLVPGNFEGSSVNSIALMSSPPADSFISEISFQRIAAADIYGTTYAVPTAPFAPLTP